MAIILFYVGAPSATAPAIDVSLTRLPPAHPSALVVAAAAAAFLRQLASFPLKRGPSPITWPTTILHIFSPSFLLSFSFFFTMHPTSPASAHILPPNYLAYACVLCPASYNRLANRPRKKIMHFSTLCFATAARGLLLESGLAQQVTTSATTAAVAGTFVFSVDLFEGETGYFNIEGFEGVQPEITMVR